MSNFFTITTLCFVAVLTFSGNTCAESNLSAKYSIPEKLDEQLATFGFNDSELDEASVEDGVLVIIFDAEKLNFSRAYKAISLICNFTKEYPYEWKEREFHKIEVMDFLQSNILTFHGGIKNCLRLPLDANYDQIKSYTEIKRGN